MDGYAMALPDHRPGCRRLPRLVGARPSFLRGPIVRTASRPGKIPARPAVERGIGWRKRWRRVATRYDKYAHRCLGLLYLAGAWIWMRPNYNPA